ncbi:MAG: YbhB/YbcL family Raf kinase inhibitor-like protein [Flavobacteriales bacterium]|nr:YbhB/YbcL family Raf kinase inhibitor-like protein [Flavobacteriales bacterium]
MIRTLALLFPLLAASAGHAQTFTLASTDLGGQATDKQVFNGFGCSGQNVSPQLSWVNAPEGTKSFAITMYDPDAPTGSGWWHWTLFDIPAAVSSIPSGASDPAKKALPKGAIEGLTDFGTAGYGGPCPPPGHGLHRYVITVHALDVESLGLDEKAGAPIVGFTINQHLLGKASIVFYYGR